MAVSFKAYGWDNNKFKQWQQGLQNILELTRKQNKAIEEGNLAKLGELLVDRGKLMRELGYIDQEVILCRYHFASLAKLLQEIIEVDKKNKEYLAGQYTTIHGDLDNLEKWSSAVRAYGQKNFVYTNGARL